jgi:hypothetical protein
VARADEAARKREAEREKQYQRDLQVHDECLKVFGCAECWS